MQHGAAALRAVFCIELGRPGFLAVYSSGQYPARRDIARQGWSIYGSLEASVVASVANSIIAQPT